MTRVLVVRNRQRVRAVNSRLLRSLIVGLLEQFQITDYELCFHLIAADEMARVNWEFLQHEGSTDVITFDHGSSPDCIHGEIFISVPDAVKQAREFGTTWPSELMRYVIHGLLHLQGFDDLRPDKRREMKREENRLLRSMESKFKLAELALTRHSKLKTRNQP